MPGQHRDDVSELDVARQPAALSGDLIGVERHLQPRTCRDELLPNPLARRADAAGRRRGVGIELAGAERCERLHGLGNARFVRRRDEPRDDGIDIRW